MTKIPPIYPISQSNLEQKSLLKWAKSLLDCGATFIQYRDKNRIDKELLDNCEKLINLFENYKATLVINDRVDIAFIVGAKAVHLGWEDIPPERARILLKKRVIVGISTHNYKEAKKAFTFPIDYLALGPVFETKTKISSEPIVSHKTQEVILKNSPFPVVAIGGINLDNARELYERGFSSLSLISTIAENPTNTYEALIKIWKSCK